MRRDAERLADIVEACLLPDAVIRQLTIVGEAPVNLSLDFKQTHPEVPWPEIAGFRNRIVHDYFGFNLDTAWQVATVHLPELGAQLFRILSDEFPGDRT